MSRHEAEVAKHRAELFTANVLANEDRADEISALDVDQWAEQRHVKIENPYRIQRSKKAMPMPSRQEMLETIEDLETENEELREKLNSVYALVSPDDEFEDSEEEEDEQ